MPSDTYFIGITQQVEAGGLARLAAGREIRPAHRVYPTGQRFLEFVAPILRVLHGDDHVEEVAVGPVLGRHGVSQELSVGLEIRAGRDFAAARLAAAVFRQARAALQDDAFVARVLPADEWADNTRPGLTVLFREPQRIGALHTLRDKITRFPGEGWPIDGFTTIPATQGSVGLVAGLRYIFLPEISVRWDLALRHRLAADLEEMDIILLDQSTKIGRMCRVLPGDPLVADAWLNWFDVIVGGIEDYDSAIHALDAAVTVAADPVTSMSRKPFSEILGLSNTGVLGQRLAALAARETESVAIVTRLPRRVRRLGRAGS